MSLARASLWTASSTLVKILLGLVVVKLLASQFGPAGVGLAGNYRQLITVLGVLAGAGIFNGVTKYVAQAEQPAQLQRIIGTASTLVLLFSSGLALLFYFLAGPISQWLFASRQYQQVIAILALLQLGIAYGNLLLAIIKGFRDAKSNALVVIAGSVFGVLGYVLWQMAAGYTGALLGLALVPAILVIPACWRLQQKRFFPWHYFRLHWDNTLVKQLSKFTLMALITTVTIPLAYVMMRNLLARQYSWHDVGIWQGVSSISDAYLQFITASFTVYLLPTLAKINDKAQIRTEIGKTFRIILPAVMTLSFLVWLSKKWVILLLFSDKFMAMQPLFAWQLTGDVCKVGAYIFGYLVIAKASLRFYLLTEVSQFVLLALFSHYLIPLHGALGATQAYMASYLCYFLLCCLVFYGYSRR